MALLQSHNLCVERASCKGAKDVAFVSSERASCKGAKEVVDAYDSLPLVHSLLFLVFFRLCQDTEPVGFFFLTVCLSLMLRGRHECANLPLLH